MKNKNAIILLLSANTVSGIAQGISMIAVPWHFANILGMPTFFGGLYAIITGISLFWGLYVGTMVDKYNRKGIFLTISVTGLFILLIAAMTGFYIGEVHYLLAGLVFAATYFIYSVHYPNLYAFAQELTETKHYGKIASYIEIQGQFTSMLAGGCAAILLSGVEPNSIDIWGYSIYIPWSIEKWELQEIFLLDASTYLLAFGLIVMIQYKPISNQNKEVGTVKERFFTGLGFLKKNPLLFLFGICSFSVFVTILVIGFFLSPIYISNHLHAGAGAYAISDVFFAFGALMAGVGIRWVFRRVTRIAAVISLTLITACIYFFYTVNQDLIWFYLTMMVLGVCNAGVRIMRTVYIFNHIPNQVIGRTNSVFGTTNVAFRLLFISSFSLPFFTSGNNVVFAFLIMGIFVLLSSLPLMVKYNCLIRS